jgi:hypothetical protein
MQRVHLADRRVIMTDLNIPHERRLLTGVEENGSLVRCAVLGDYGRHPNHCESEFVAVWLRIVDWDLDVG